MFWIFFQNAGSQLCFRFSSEPGSVKIPRHCSKSETITVTDGQISRGRDLNCSMRRQGVLLLLVVVVVFFGGVVKTLCVVVFLLSLDFCVSVSVVFFVCFLLSLFR